MLTEKETEDLKQMLNICLSSEVAHEVYLKAIAGTPNETIKNALKMSSNAVIAAESLMLSDKEGEKRKEYLFSEEIDNYFIIGLSYTFGFSSDDEFAAKCEESRKKADETTDMVTSRRWTEQQRRDASVPEYREHVKQQFLHFFYRGYSLVRDAPEKALELFTAIKAFAVAGGSFDAGTENFLDLLAFD